MILIAIFILLPALLCWLLFVPVTIDIDSARAAYKISQPVTVSFWFTTDLKPHMKLFGVSIPFRKSTTRMTEAAKPKKNKSKKSNFSIRRMHQLLKGILRSITIKKLALDIDTDDVVYNAKLVPLCYSLSHGPVELNTNFYGRVYACFNAEIRLYKIGWAFILFSINKNKKLWK